jgi:hypothetical protein
MKADHKFQICDCSKSETEHRLSGFQNVLIAALNQRFLKERKKNGERKKKQLKRKGDVRGEHE